MNVDEYLARINCSGLRNAQPTLENLKKLVTSHLATFPVENLDMHMGEFQSCSLEFTYNRLINKRKGGICIQLNRMFDWLLKALGYEATFQPAYMYNNFLKKYYRLPLHIANIVWLDDETGRKPYYADVGAFRLINEPIKIEPGLIQQTKMGIYRFLADQKHLGYFVLQRTKSGSDLNNCEWSIQLKFKITGEFPLSDLEELNKWVQTPEHPGNFYRTGICRHLSPYSQLHLIGRKLTKTVCSDLGDDVASRVLEDADEITRVLRDEFKIRIDYDRFKPRDDYNLDTFATKGEETIESELPVVWKKFILP